MQKDKGGNSMSKKFMMSSSPHIRHGDRTNRIMLDVLIALIPASLAGVYFFGSRVLLVIAVTVGVSVISELLARIIMKRENTIQDLSAAVTGLLLALNLPPEIPLWIAAIGAILAVVVVKQLFGGLGQNFMNPALGARVILTVSWPTQMTNWLIPQADAVSSATPLAMIGSEGMVQQAELPTYWELFVGNIGGCIGETSALALLIGAVYLIIRRIINIEIPLTFVGTVALFTWTLGGDTAFSGDFVYHVLAGGLILGAFYMATDYASSPMTVKGRVIMGVGAGFLTSMIRLYGGYPEGVSFAIIIMNILVPLIDRYTIPVSFGGVKNAK